MNLGITPCFTAYNKPWNNGCVEGANSVFVRRILRKVYIRNAYHLAYQIDRFNQAYERKLRITPKGKTLPKDFTPPLVKQTTLRRNLKKPTICFVRQVLEEKESSQSAICVLKVPIKLDKQYLKQFVLAKLDVYARKLKTIKSMSFPVKYR